MGSACHTCHHFRPYRPLSQRLAAELGLEHPEALSELVRIMQDERQRRDEEAGLKVKLLADRFERWPLKPQMSSFCALEAEDGRHLLCELKNRGARCADHRPEPAPDRSCATCVHRRAPEGPARDQQVMAHLARLAQDAAALGTSPSGPTQDEYKKVVGNTVAYEVTQAYYLGKVSLRAPSYLSVCKKFSTNADFVLCALQNPHDACAAHEAPPPRDVAAGGPQPSGDSAPASADAPRPGGIPRPTWRQP